MEVLNFLVVFCLFADTVSSKSAGLRQLEKGDGANRLLSRSKRYLSTSLSLTQTGLTSWNKQPTGLVIDGGWSAWSVWTVCTKSCDTGQQKRYRECNNPIPANGGAPCVGDNAGYQFCNTHGCAALAPINGAWSTWSAWSKCPVTCGSGIITRTRTCTNPPPSNGGLGCPSTFGGKSEIMDCVNPICTVPINGAWSAWSAWSKCPVTCGTGSIMRTRTCTNPPPSNGGLGCPSTYGGKYETMDCPFITACPVPINGAWSAWSAWSKCPVTCGAGIITRTRTCTNPPPSNGGLGCPSTFGGKSEIMDCVNPICTVPINGAWSAWSAWSKCPVTCGTGSIMRTRTCTNPPPSNGGLGCPSTYGGKYETMDCPFISACPVPINGAWSAWSAWSKCPVTCGTGSIMRTRTCTNPSPSNGGLGCPSTYGGKYETMDCPFISACPVPINGAWSAWSAWSKCPVTCGTGSIMRTRTCTNPPPSNGGLGCPSTYGGKYEKMDCPFISACPVDGNWGDWTPWSKCSASCGGGQMERHRICDNPSPSSGGAHCLGLPHEIQDCNTNICTMDGNWGAWTPWSKCSASCGGGHMERMRICDNPPPSFGGADCSGLPHEIENCNTHLCAINGAWADWSAWSACPVTCGAGTVFRTRTCDNPPPSNGGLGCPSTYGGKYESKDCNVPSCPVDGGWDDWTTWTTCSTTCGGGLQERTRACVNPPPAHGGAYCIGKDAMSQPCNWQDCPLDGGWSDWTPWSKCPVTCGGSKQERIRTCTNPSPAFGGKDCSGTNNEVQDCSTQSCPIDGGWTDWTQWDTCTATCGGGTQQRERSCTKPAPQFGGRDCVGDLTERLDCNIHNCPVDGRWSDWTTWDTCSVSCGGGMQGRSRSCTNPAPQYGGASCVGDNSEEQDCNSHLCPIDGGWNNWSVWDVCSLTCGGGSQARYRSCTNPSPQHGGNNCVGDLSESQDCNTQKCPIDGVFTDWSNWDTCSVSCGGGTQGRSRSCSNPPPQYGGANCVGDITEDQDCNVQNCPIDGGLTDWSNWDTCSVSCGGGTQGRSRSCTNPAPQYGGANCVGDLTENQGCNVQNCPIDGGLTGWSNWDTCSVTCGGGTQGRSRYCTNPPPQYGGANCVGDLTENQDCNIHNCPIDGGLTGWSNWDTCSVSCGGGTQGRTRSCTNPPPQYGGANCVGDLTEDQGCNVQNCPIDGGLTDWTTWDTCSVTCGGGTQGRSRSCTNPVPQYGGSYCVGDLSENKDCNTQNCPINGGLTDWTTWDTCSVTCGGGTQGRSRSCTNPPPQYGGANCVGDLTENQDCNVQNCPIDGGFADWSAWDTCSVTCGGGSQGRSRSCTNPVPQYGGADCVGNLTDSQACNTQNCPIDGGFSNWSVWDTCSVTCGGGTQGRLRSCTNPIPQYGGANCIGNLTDRQICNIQNCPIDGGFDDWSAWDTCSVTCGGGSQGRSRSCSNPAPQYGGADCMGNLTDSQDCNTHNCPIDGGLTDWSAWETCSHTCGGGSQGRSRSCTNPVPQYGGASCVGNLTETQDCNVQNCPIDGGWADWSNWDVCSTTCGGGNQSRSRTCSNPAPQYGGVSCVGDDIESQNCNTHNCPIDGGWADWTVWDTCSVTCGGGFQSRDRSCSNPIPQYGGADCMGNMNETQDCNSQNCPIDGGWTDWTAWDTCSVTCGGGIQGRERACTNPVPQYGGNSCLGATTEFQNCSTNNCPIDGGWDTWGVWGNCSVECGGGYQTRERDCSNPVPQYGGANCTGHSVEDLDCNSQPCPVNGEWSQWGAWGTCSVTCGGGQAARARTCSDPYPANGGANCVGDSSEYGVCNNDSCPTPAPGTYVNMCPTGYFTCQNGTINCVELAFTCDCTADCEDASDELPDFASCDPAAAQACFASWAGAPVSIQLSVLAMFMIILSTVMTVNGWIV